MSRLILFLAIYTAFRLPFLIYRYFDIDELEHAHAAFCVAKGLIPYRDFLELHPPLFYPMLAPLTSIHSPVVMLWASRGLMLAGVLLLLAWVWIWTEKRAGTRGAVLSGLLLISFTFFSLKSLEIRPDVPAMVLLGFLTLREQRERAWWMWLGMGTLGGIAVLFSLKSLFPLAGWMIGILLANGWKKSVMPLAAMTTGMAWPLTATAFWLASRQASDPAWFCLFTLSRHLSGWPLMESLWPALRDNPLWWAGGLIGAVRYGRQEPAITGALVGSLALLVLSPSNYPQNYLFLSPYISVLGALILIRLWNSPAGLVVLLGSMTWSFYRQFPLMARPNTAQRATFACVEKHTAPQDHVFDVWSGESFFRPHASYTWYLPQDILGALNPVELERGLQSALLDPQCRAVIYDPKAWERLPASVQTILNKRFRPVCDRLAVR